MSEQEENLITETTCQERQLGIIKERNWPLVTMHPRQSPDPLASVQCSLPMTYTASSHNKMALADNHHRRAWDIPSATYCGWARFTSNKPKFTPSQRSLDSPNKRFQKEVAFLPWDSWAVWSLSLNSLMPCRWHFHQYISLPCPTSVVGACSLGCCQSDWPMSRL